MTDHWTGDQVRDLPKWAMCDGYCVDKFYSIADTLDAQQAELAAAEWMRFRVVEFRQLIYPKDIFVGCEDCENDSCDCDPGVKHLRRMNNAIAAYAALSDPAEKDS
jgi:hypothetical protein